MAYVGFNRLKARLARRKGVRNAAALAAYIGRKKYGKARFQRAAARGRPLRGARRR
jgi:hypothetical protein